MIKKILSLTALAMVVGVAQADQDLRLVLPMSPGGGTGTMSKFVEQHLEENGYNVDLQIVGNVANAKRIYQDSSDVPTIVAWENGYLLEEGHIGNIGAPSSEDFFNVWFWAPYYACSVDGYDDILTADANLGLNPHPSFPQWFVDAIVEENPGINPITYPSSAEIKTALVSGEIDLTISDRALAWQNEGLVNCQYNTSTENASGLPPLGKAMGQDGLGFSLVVYSFALNMDSETIASVREDFQSALRSEQVVKFFNGRGADQTVMQKTGSEQLDFLNSTLGN